MQLGTQEHQDLIKQFDREFKGHRLDKESKELWARGRIYQDGHVNDLFLTYRRGYAFARSVYLSAEACPKCGLEGLEERLIEVVRRRQNAANLWLGSQIADALIEDIRAACASRYSDGVAIPTGNTVYEITIDQETVDELATGVCPESLARRMFELMEWRRAAIREQVRSAAPLFQTREGQ